MTGFKGRADAQTYMSPVLVPELYAVHCLTKGEEEGRRGRAKRVGE